MGLRSSFSIIIIFTALALAGLMLVGELPVKLFPSRELPSLTVSFRMPFNSSRVVEEEVTRKLEGALSRVSGVRKTESRSSNGMGWVMLGLDRHADMGKARMEASMTVRSIWDSFPEGVSYPEVSVRSAHDDSKGPFMTFTVTSPETSMQITSYVDKKVRPVLADIPGVASVDLYGAVPMELSLEYDADLLDAAGVSLSAIREAIARHYGSEFIGIASSHDGMTGIVGKGDGKGDSLDASQIYVKTAKGETIRLDRLVKVTRREGRPVSLFRINGMNSIYLNIAAEENANQLVAARLVAQAMERVRESAPAGMSFILSSDSTETIREELDKIRLRTALTVLILLLFVGIVVRSFRYTVLIVTGLAINMSLAVIFYYIFGTEIQLYSLAGITISLNLVIDNIIVMCDHYMRCRDRRAFPAVLAATLTTVGALMVVFLLDEEVRRNLEDFTIVVAVNLLVSLSVAYFLVPAYADKIGLKRKRKRSGYRNKVVRRLERLYAGYIRFSVRWKWAFLFVMAAAAGLSGYTFFERVKEGTYFNRDNTEKTLYVNASLPNGSTVAQMDFLMRKMESFLSGFREIRQFRTNVYNGRQGSIAISFTRESGNTGFPYRLKSEIIAKALTLGGGSWGVYGLDDNGFSNDVKENAGSYRVKMYGFNYDELEKYAESFRDSLLAHRRIKEVEVKSDFSWWKEDYSEFMLSADREALALEGLTVNDFFTSLYSIFGRDINAGSIYRDGYEERIFLSSRQGELYDVWALINVPFNIGGKSHKLSEFATFEKGNVAQDIVKENQSYRLCLQYEYIGSGEQGRKVLERKVEEFSKKLPAGYRIERDENSWQWDDKDYSRYWLLAIVTLVIFFISAVLFNSLKRPLAIIAVIPMSYVGIFLTFWLFDLKFDQGGFASFVLLSGITVNAAIYLINEFDNRKTSANATRMKTIALYLNAFRVKIMPVVMTVLSTVLGFLPFLIGTERESFWFALAAGTTGGLVFSLVAIVFWLPLLVISRRTVRGR